MSKLFLLHFSAVNARVKWIHLHMSIATQIPLLLWRAFAQIAHWMLLNLAMKVDENFNLYLKNCKAYHNSLKIIFRANHYFSMGISTFEVDSQVFDLFRRIQIADEVVASVSERDERSWKRNGCCVVQGAVNDFLAFRYDRPFDHHSSVSCSSCAFDSFHHFNTFLELGHFSDLKLELFSDLKLELFFLKLKLYSFKFNWNLLNDCRGLKKCKAAKIKTLKFNRNRPII